MYVSEHSCWTRKFRVLIKQLTHKHTHTHIHDPITHIAFIHIDNQYDNVWKWREVAGPAIVHWPAWIDMAAYNKFTYTLVVSAQPVGSFGPDNAGTENCPFICALETLQKTVVREIYALMGVNIYIYRWVAWVCVCVCVCLHMHSPSITIIYRCYSKRSKNAKKKNKKKDISSRQVFANRCKCLA